jgi:hypothetical protein
LENTKFEPGVYLLSFSILSLVSFTIDLQFLIKGSLVLFSFFNYLVPHFLLLLLLLLKINGILAVLTRNARLKPDHKSKFIPKQ